VLAHGGRAVLLTSAANQPVMASTIGPEGCLKYCWSSVQCRGLVIGFKMQAHIYVMQRSDELIRPFDGSRVLQQCAEQDDAVGPYPFKLDNPDLGFRDEPLEWEPDGGNARWDVQWVRDVTPIEETVDRSSYLPCFTQVQVNGASR